MSYQHVDNLYVWCGDWFEFLLVHEREKKSLVGVSKSSLNVFLTCSSWLCVFLASLVTSCIAKYFGCSHN